MFLLCSQLVWQDRASRHQKEASSYSCQMMPCSSGIKKCDWSTWIRHALEFSKFCLPSPNAFYSFFMIDTWDKSKRTHQKRATNEEKVVTLQRDGSPGLSGVHKGCIGDLLSDVLILIKGERTTQTHIYDDAHRPHVQGAVVTIAADHLRSQVGRGAHHRPSERLLANDAGEAEVAQLHLQHRQGGALVWPVLYIKYTCIQLSQNATWGKGSAEASSTFSGFRSQWAMCLRCRYRRASRIWNNMKIMSFPGYDCKFNKYGRLCWWLQGPTGCKTARY